MTNNLLLIATTIFCLLLLIMLIWIFGFSPDDYQQANTVKIMYLHVPFAWTALLIYFVVGILSISIFIWNSPISTIFMQSMLPIGAISCTLALVTGSIWGKPIWGTWWVWDGRLTSMLILLLIYISHIIVVAETQMNNKYNKISAALGIVGMINVPIVKFSVDLWNSLHQPSSILRSKGIAIHETILYPLIFSWIVLIVFSMIIFIINVKTATLHKKIININLR